MEYRVFKQMIESIEIHNFSLFSKNYKKSVEIDEGKIKNWMFLLEFPD